VIIPPFETGDFDLSLYLFFAKEEVMMLPVDLFIFVKVLFWFGW
jgi:hypothetical protein